MMFLLMFNLLSRTNVLQKKKKNEQGSIFPLPAENNYSGEVIYTVPRRLKPTNMYQRGVFEREYDLTVSCDLSMRKNLKVRFPVVIAQP